MNQRRRYRVTIALMLALSLMLLSGCSFLERVPKLEANDITARLEGIQELATAKMTMKGIIHVSEGRIPFLDKKEFFMLYRATVKAGFDLSQAEIEVTETAVSITLPAVELLDVIVDENSLEFYNVYPSIFNWEELEDAVDAIAMAKEDILAQPEIEDLKKTAVDQVKALLTGLLEGQIGERELIVNVK